MIQHDVLLNIITEALAAYIKEMEDKAYRRGVERGRSEERQAERLRKEDEDYA